MTSTPQTLPHWDMSVVYPGIESPEFAQDFTSLIEAIGELKSLFDRSGVDRRESIALDDDLVTAFESVIERMNVLLDQQRTIQAYLHSFVTTDSRNDLAQARVSELQRHLVQLSQLDTRFTAWLGSMDVEALIERSQVASDHAFLLRQSYREATHQMSPAEEDLAAELRVSGGMAWAKLHTNLTSQIMVPLERNGTTEQLPMSMIRNLAYDGDRETRRSAYEAELASWSANALPIAAALNGVKGETLTLTRRRGWESPLDQALFDNSIDRPTLDAMMTAARESFPDFRRYLQAKATALGLDKLAWYDIFAPVGSSTKVWGYDDATDFIVEQFATFSPKLSGMAARAFSENWIDAEPRSGKRDGAFCMSLRRDESRVLANFKPSFGGVSTLAHELGHAYHNLTLADRTMLQRSHPMTLAETASIFCETIVRQSALKDADAQEQLAILEASLQGSCQVVVDITSRFLFEQRVFERRADRELSIDEFNQIMLDAQRETYGEGLDQGALHPYMWAVKGHYYGRSFYNYPYMFGLLFGLGLYARYQSDPDGFKAGYDDLLSSTGLADAATLAGRFGIDIRTPDFWRASLDTVRADIDQFEALVGQQAGA